MLYDILVPVAILAGLGLIFGGILAFASKKFAVKKDEKVEAVRELLPGANCGGCGFAGCDSFAEAVAQGKAPVGGCPVGGNELGKKLGALLGISYESVGRRVARVHCQGGVNCKNRFEPQDVDTCREAHMVGGGKKACIYGCLGEGDCTRVCKFGAIAIGENGVARVDEAKCTACGMCVKECPVNIIWLVEAKENVADVLCHTQEKGKAVREVCSNGCIGCGLCVRACEYDALKMDNNLPKIDHSKCTACGKCVEKCPTRTMQIPFKG